MIIEKPQLDFGDAVKQAVNRVFEFKGRSRRSEYWWTMLFVYIIDIVLTPAFGSLLHLATIPLTVRRLHDTGHSGWWLFGSYLANAILVIMLIVDYIMAIVSIAGGAFEDGGGLEFLLVTLGKYAIAITLLIVYKLLILIFLCQDSDKKTNKYGASPKYVSENAQAHVSEGITMPLDEN